MGFELYQEHTPFASVHHTRNGYLRILVSRRARDLVELAVGDRYDIQICRESRRIAIDLCVNGAFRFGKNFIVTSCSFIERDLGEIADGRYEAYIDSHSGMLVIDFKRPLGSGDTENA